MSFEQLLEWAVNPGLQVLTVALMILTIRNIRMSELLLEEQRKTTIAERGSPETKTGSKGGASSRPHGTSQERTIDPPSSTSV